MHGSRGVGARSRDRRCACYDPSGVQQRSGRDGLDTSRRRATGYAKRGRTGLQNVGPSR